MALISPDTKHYVKMLRNVLVGGKGRVEGDIVEVDLETQRKLIAMGMAIAHTPVVEKVNAVAQKAVDKVKGK